MSMVESEGQGTKHGDGCDAEGLQIGGASDSGSNGRGY